MRKLPILMPLALLAMTSLGQSSECVVQPNCGQLGYSQTEADCAGFKMLKCPFDVTQVACFNNNGAEGGMGNNPNDPNNEFGDALVFEITLTSAKTLYFSFGGGNIVVDCGNGKIARAGTSATGSSYSSCGYTEAGTYIFKATGSFTFFSGDASSSSSTSPYLKSAISAILKLDKTGITKMSYMCYSGTKGFIPPLPSTLKNGTNMFYDCENLTGEIPKLPDTLEIADRMFCAAGNLTGKVPDIPPALVSANEMFYACRKLTGTPQLPASLSSAKYMFSMNYYSSGGSTSCIYSYKGSLSGTLQDFSTLPNLTSYQGIFSCSGFEAANNSSWPAAAFAAK